jgi:hypothetical protein
MAETNYLIGNVYIFAVRYAMGRKTGAGLAVAYALKDGWENISELTKKQILKEIEEEAPKDSDLRLVLNNFEDLR